MSVDSQRIIDFINMFNVLWSAPFQIGTALYLLWNQLGIASLSGMAVIILLMPTSGFITSKLRGIQVGLMKEKDKRVKLINEILNGIKVLKLYAWENSFKDQIIGFRYKEIESLKSIAYYSSGMTFTFICVPFFV